MNTYRIDYINHDGVEQYVTLHAHSIAEALEKFKTDNYMGYVSLQKYVFIGEWHTSTYIVTKWADDTETYTDYFDDVAECMNKASYLVAFDDLSEMEEIKVVVNGREVEYAGWEPGMRYVWVDKQTGEVVWDNCYPSWDH